MDFPAGTTVEHDDEDYGADDRLRLTNLDNEMVTIQIPDYNGEPMKMDIELGEFELEIEIESSNPPSTPDVEPETTEEEGDEEAHEHESEQHSG